MESVLETIKKMLGITEDYTHFDTDIMVHINTVFMTLNQLGVGPEEPPVITGGMETWTTTLGERKDIEAIKTYVYLKVRILFDPPTSSFVLDSMKNLASELEWRLRTQAELNKED